MSATTDFFAPLALPVHWRVLCAVLRGYIRTVHTTGTWQRQWHPDTHAHVDADKPYIAVFWHSRLLMMPYAKLPQQPFVMLTSRNVAGALTGSIVAPFGIGVVRGSSADPTKPHKNKGGSDALRGLLQALQQGLPVGITPDGPRGPAQTMTLGAIQLARLSGIPIIPVSFSCKRGYVGRGWDKMLWPFPFSSGIIRAGAPIFVPRTLDEAGIEQQRLQIQQALIDLTAALDAEHGR